MTGRHQFGELIKNARERRGLTGVDLAQKVGRSHSMIVRWENGQPSNAPEPELFWAFSRTLGLEPELMLEALGYLEEDAERPTENEAVSAIRPILESKDFTERQIHLLASMVRDMVEMMEAK